MSLGVRNRVPKHSRRAACAGHEVEVLAGHAPMALYGDPPYVHRALTLRGFEPAAPHTKEIADTLNIRALGIPYANTATLLNGISADSALILSMSGTFSAWVASRFSTCLSRMCSVGDAPNGLCP